MIPSFRNRTLRDWLAETHAAGFELVRHFLACFFESEMVSSSGDWLKLAIGLLAVLLSFSILALKTYADRYARLLNPQISTEALYRHGIRADMLSFLALAMAITALLTALQWQSLFHGWSACHRYSYNTENGCCTRFRK